jgi:hypothetical protein
MSCRISFRFGGAIDPATELVGKICGGVLPAAEKQCGGGCARERQSLAIKKLTEHLRHVDTSPSE